MVLDDLEVASERLWVAKLEVVLWVAKLEVVSLTLKLPEVWGNTSKAGMVLDVLDLGL